MLRSRPPGHARRPTSRLTLVKRADVDPPYALGESGIDVGRRRRHWRCEQTLKGVLRLGGGVVARPRGTEHACGERALALAVVRLVPRLGLAQLAGCGRRSLALA